MLLAYAIPLSHSSLHKRWRGSSYPILLWLLYQHRYLDGLISLAFTLPFIMKRCSSLEHTSKLFYFCSVVISWKKKRRTCVCKRVVAWGQTMARCLFKGYGAIQCFPFARQITGKDQQKCVYLPKLCFTAIYCKTGYVFLTQIKLLCLCL